MIDSRVIAVVVLWVLFVFFWNSAIQFHVEPRFRQFLSHRLKIQVEYRKRFRGFTWEVPEKTDILPAFLVGLCWFALYFGMILGMFLILSVLVYLLAFIRV